MPDLPARYEALVASGAIERDPAQVALVARLEALARELEGYRPLAAGGGLLGRLFGGTPPAPPRGLYVHGAVGRGKTMLMDLFFARVDVAAKRRTHFNDFMADVHARVHAARARVQGDPLGPVAAAMAREAWLLCFDEFAVGDIADAMILGRLFDGLFAAGVVVVATSNVAPGDLYAGGLNRALFLPFVARLTQRVDVLRLEARADFRLEAIEGAPVWRVPPDAGATKALDRAFSSLAGGAPARGGALKVGSREVEVPAQAGGVARFSFSQLCEAPLAAADYAALARAFHTLVLDGVPVLTYERRNAAKRFILLIDTLYEHRVKLVASAEAEPDELYTAADGREAFEFARTVSRLHEMRGRDYLGSAHGRPVEAVGSLAGDF